MIIKIKKNNMGYNGACGNCNKVQAGSGNQPLIVYFKDDNEKRGTNYTACCEKCAKELAEMLSK